MFTRPTGQMSGLARIVVGIKAVGAHEHRNSTTLAIVLKGDPDSDSLNAGTHAPPILRRDTRNRLNEAAYHSRRPLRMGVDKIVSVPVNCSLSL